MRQEGVVGKVVGEAAVRPLVRVGKEDTDKARGKASGISNRKGKRPRLVIESGMCQGSVSSGKASSLWLSRAATALALHRGTRVSWF